MTITDDDSRTIIITDVSQSEGDSGTTVYTFIVTLINPVQGRVSVNYATADDSATLADNDYTSATCSLNFAGTSGEPHMFTVNVNGDMVAEGNEAFTVSLNTVSNAGVDITDTAQGIISNDDNAVIILVETGGLTSIAEGGATDSFTLNAATPPTATVSLTVTPDSQCTVSPSPVILPAGSTAAQVVTVTAVDDGVAEGAGTHPCLITLSTSTSADGFYNGINAGNVTDNDAAGIFVSASPLTVSEENTTSATFTLNATTPPAGNVDVPLTAGADCEVSADNVTFGANATLTLTSGNTTPVNADVRSVNDGLAEAASEVCTLTTGDPSGGGDPLDDALIGTDVSDVNADVLDNDITFTISNSDTSGTTTPADFAAALPSATLSFAANGAAQTVTANVVGDSISEADFTLEFQVTGSTSGTSGTASLVGLPSTVTVSDDDTAGITLTGVPGNVSEGVGTFSYRVNLDTEPTSPVQIDLSATGCAITSPNPLLLTPANWNGVADNLIESVTDNPTAGANPDCVVSYAVNAAASADEYDPVTEPDSTITVDDDDVPGITLTGVPGNVSEGMGTFSYRLNLDVQPTSDVQIDLPTGATIDATITDEFDNRFSELEILSNSLGAASLSGNTLTVRVSLQPGTSGVITVAATISSRARPGDVITNVASLQYNPTFVSAPVTITILPNSLPATGETPAWRMPLLLMLAVLGFLVLMTVLHPQLRGGRL